MMPDNLPIEIHWPRLRLLAKQQTISEHRTSVKTGNCMAYALFNTTESACRAGEERRGAERCEHSCPTCHALRIGCSLALHLRLHPCPAAR